MHEPGNGGAPYSADTGLAAVAASDDIKAAGLVAVGVNGGAPFSADTGLAAVVASDDIKAAGLVAVGVLVVVVADLSACSADAPRTGLRSENPSERLHWR